MKRKIFVYVFAILILIWSFFPLWIMLIASISPEINITSNGFAVIPTAFTDRNYRWVFQIYSLSEFTGNFGSYFGSLIPQIPMAFLNSAILATSASVIGIAISAMAGYVFGRLRFRLKNGLLFLFLSSQMVPSITIVIPYFVLLTQVGLIGTYPGVIITYLTLILPLATWVLSGYFATLPREVENAARIDGCSRLRALWSVVFRMARPGIVAVWLLTLMLAWNELLFGLLIGGNTVKPIQPLILQFSPLNVGSGPVSQFSLTGGMMIVSLIPPLILALFFQRYLTRLNIVDPVAVLQ